MKVVLLAPTPPPFGGIAGWTVRMIEAKLKNNWEVVVVDEKVSEGRDVFGDNKKRNFKAEIKRCFRIWSELIKQIKDSDVKVVHSCIPSTTFAMMREYICSIISKVFGKKFIIHFRCTVPNTTKGKIGNLILKYLCNNSSYIISLNSQTESYLKNITKTPIITIPNFISSEEVSDSHIINERIKKVLYVGGVIETKGVIDILKVAQQFPNIEFRFVGNAESIILDFAKNNKILNAIFLGSMDKIQIKEELKNADIFLFLTYFYGEGFSNALAEAMAVGLPCIVTRWAANADMIDDIKGGFIVPIKSPTLVIDALKKCFPLEIRKSQSVYNILKVKNEYTDNIILNKYVDIYEKLIKE